MKHQLVELIEIIEQIVTVTVDPTYQAHLQQQLAELKERVENG